MREKMGLYIRESVEKTTDDISNFLPPDDEKGKKELFTEVTALITAMVDFVIYVEIDDESKTRNIWNLYIGELEVFLRERLDPKDDIEEYMLTIIEKSKSYQTISKLTIKETLWEFFVFFGKNAIKISTLKRDYVFKQATPIIIQCIKKSYDSLVQNIFEENKRTDEPGDS